MPSNKNCKAKICIRCGSRFNRRTNRSLYEKTETPEEFASRKYCSIGCMDPEYIQAHQLVRIRQGNYYLTLDKKWTNDKDSAKLFHPSVAQTEINNIPALNGIVLMTEKI